MEGAGHQWTSWRKSDRREDYHLRLTLFGTQTSNVTFHSKIKGICFSSFHWICTDREWENNAPRERNPGFHAAEKGS